MFAILRFSVAAFILLFCTIITLHAQENSGNDGSLNGTREKHCLMVQKIKKIEIVDNQTILFHSYHGEIWRNRLPTSCQGLKIEGGIRYSSSGYLICDLDTVTVLNLETPCMLGKFEKIKK